MVADEHRISLTRYHLAIVNIALWDLAAREAMVADEHRIVLTRYHLAMVNIACRDLDATHDQQAMTAVGRETCIAVKQEVERQGHIVQSWRGIGYLEGSSVAGARQAVEIPGALSSVLLVTDSLSLAKGGAARELKAS
jgi:hypothetical protein